jgi:hypothetical protein
MDKIKPILESADVLVKIVIAILAFLIFQVQQNRLVLEGKQIENLKEQQSSNLVVAEKIISLLYEEKNKCIAEDQAYMIDFLIDNNNAYNKIQIDKEDFYRVSAARRNCAGGSIAQDAQTTVSLSADGQVPILTPLDIQATQERLKEKGVTVAEATAESVKPSGYVAVGAFSPEDKTFRNFEVASNHVSADGSIIKGTIIKSRWSVYLRANTRNTEQGANPILGLVAESSCAKVVESFPGVRGQTWAAVNLVDCPSSGTN